MIALVALPLLFFLPGFLTLRGALSDSPRWWKVRGNGRSRAANASPKHLDLIEAIGLSMAASILLSSVIAFTLVLIGIFSLWLLLTVVGSYSLLVALATWNIRRNRKPFPTFPLDRGAVLIALSAIVIVCIAFILYSRYSENVLLFRDPATYVNTGVHIAKSGTSLIDDPLFYSLDEDLQATLVYERPVDAEIYNANRFDGFQVEYRLRGFARDAQLGRTAPQFFNLFPTWQAIGYSTFGMLGVFLVSPLFGALSLLLIFLVGRRLFGSAAGLVAAALLSVNLAHFWYAKTPGSEILAQTTFLAAVLFWTLFSTTRNRLLGVFAGIGFGALIMVRIDSVIIVGATGFLFLYAFATRRIERRDLFFLLPFVTVATLGLIDALYSSRTYVMLVYKASSVGTKELGGLAIVATLALIVGAFPRLGVSSLLRSLETSHGARIRSALGIGLIGLAIFAYFVRPEIQETFSWSGTGRIIAWHAEDSFVRLGWYVSPLGILVATIGGALAISRSTGRALSLFLLASLLTTLVVLYNPAVWPDHFWAGRRYVPVIIPMSLLFIGLVIQLIGWGLSDSRPPSNVAIHEAPRGRSTDSQLGHSRRSTSPTGWLRFILSTRSQTVRRGLAFVVFAVLFGTSVYQISGFVSYRDQEGSSAEVREVALMFPKDAVIVFDNSLLGNVLAPSLKLIHGLEAFVLGPPYASDSYDILCDSSSAYPSAEDPRSCILDELLTATNPRSFFWVTTRNGEPQEQPRITQESFEKLDARAFTIQVPMLEQTVERLPKAPRVDVMTLEGIVYRARRNSDSGGVPSITRSTISQTDRRPSLQDSLRLKDGHSGASTR